MAVDLNLLRNHLEGLRAKNIDFIFADLLLSSSQISILKSKFLQVQTKLTNISAHWDILTDLYQGDFIKLYRVYEEFSKCILEHEDFDEVSALLNFFHERTQIIEKKIALIYPASASTGTFPQLFIYFIFGLLFFSC